MSANRFHEMNYAFLNQFHASQSAQKKILINKEFPENVGDYTCYLGGVSFAYEKYIESHGITDTEEFAIFSAKKITDQKGYKESNWKIHLTVHQDDLAAAWDVVYPELIKFGVPHFKVARLAIINKLKDTLINVCKDEVQLAILPETLHAMSPEEVALAKATEVKERNDAIESKTRVMQGMQITIYIPQGLEHEYNRLLTILERALYENKIKPGLISTTDKIIGRYASVRQDISLNNVYVNYEKTNYYFLDEDIDQFKTHPMSWKKDALSRNAIELNYSSYNMVALQKHMQLVMKNLLAAEQEYETLTIDKKKFVKVYKAARNHVRRVLDIIQNAAATPITDKAGFKKLAKDLACYNDIVKMGKKYGIGNSILSKTDKIYQLQVAKLYQEYVSPKLMRRSVVRTDLNKRVTNDTLSKFPAISEIVIPSLDRLKKISKIQDAVFEEVQTRSIEKGKSQAEKQTSESVVKERALNRKTTTKMLAEFSQRLDKSQPVVVSSIMESVQVIAGSHVESLPSPRSDFIETKKPRQSVATLQALDLSESMIDIVVNQKPLNPWPTWKYVLPGVAIAILLAAFVIATSGTALVPLLAGLGLSIFGAGISASAAAITVVAGVGVIASVIGAIGGLIAKAIHTKCRGNVIKEYRPLSKEVVDSASSQLEYEVQEKPPVRGSVNSEYGANMKYRPDLFGSPLTKQSAYTNQEISYSRPTSMLLA